MNCGTAEERLHQERCHVCGVTCNVYPDPPERGVCPDHCEHPAYTHDRHRRGYFCDVCDQEIDTYDLFGPLA